MAQPNFGVDPKVAATVELFQVASIPIEEFTWVAIMSTLGKYMALHDGRAYPTRILMLWWRAHGFWRWPDVVRATSNNEFRKEVAQILSRQMAAKHN